MNTREKSEFLVAIAEAKNLLAQAQAAVQRARSQCHAHIYEHVELMSKRLYELKVTSEWLHQGMLGRFDLVSQGEMSGRQSPDRRNDIDRRIAGMRKHLLFFNQ